LPTNGSAAGSHAEHARRSGKEMNTLITLLASTLISGAALAQQAGAVPPIANSPVVEIKGNIEKIQISPGEGMPFLQVKSKSDSTKVYLGSMRYLMEQDFKPKAGDEVTVKGYRVNSDVVAVTVDHNGKVLRLRDEKGFPVWRGGPFGRGRGAAK